MARIQRVPPGYICAAIAVTLALASSAVAAPSFPPHHHTQGSSNRPASRPVTNDSADLSEDDALDQRKLLTDTNITTVGGIKVNTTSNGNKTEKLSVVVPVAGVVVDVAPGKQGKVDVLGSNVYTGPTGHRSLLDVNVNTIGAKVDVATPSPSSSQLSGASPPPGPISVATPGVKVDLVPGGQGSVKVFGRTVWSGPVPAELPPHPKPNGAPRDP